MSESIHRYPRAVPARFSSVVLDQSLESRPRLKVSVKGFGLRLRFRFEVKVKVKVKVEVKVEVSFKRLLKTSNAIG